MISKTLKFLVVLAFILAVGGLAVLSFWKVPVEQKQVEQELDVSSLVKK